MKYFEFNIGDYQGKTAHLSLAEHGAYLLMMMLFYTTEKPIPTDRRVLYRLLRAESPAERKAIDAVAREFWSEMDGKLTNKRCDETLSTYTKWVARQKANGSKGGRPPQTQTEPIANPSLTHGKANGLHDLESYSESHSETHSESHTHSDSEPRAMTRKNGGPTGHAAPERVGGNFEKAGSGWRPPTEEEIRAGK